MGKLRSTELREEILRLRKMREELGYSQEEFAELLEIHSSTYKKIEIFERRISLNNLKMLHKKLSVSVDYILFGEEAPKQQAWESEINFLEKNTRDLFLRLYRYLSVNRPDDESVSASLDEAFRAIAQEESAEGRG